MNEFDGINLSKPDFFTKDEYGQLIACPKVWCLDPRILYTSHNCRAIRVPTIFSSFQVHAFFWFEEGDRSKQMLVRWDTINKFTEVFNNGR